MSKRIIQINLEGIGDCPNKSILDKLSTPQLFIMMRNCLDGYLGIRAVAEIEINEVVQTICSGGIYGLESNDTEYMVVVEGEQLSELRYMLMEIGFGEREIKTAIERRRNGIT
jgi:hypothetical protein